MIVNHNMSSMNASRMLGQVVVNVGDTAEKLSSGYRINRSADDAAGLSISEKLRWQVRGLNRASRNAQDGISFIQTAEGALDEIHSLLQRARELSVQAANDTNEVEDREALAKEIEALGKEVDRIAKDTEFNTLKIFDSSDAVSSSRVGPERVSARGNDAPMVTLDGTDIMQYGIENIQDAINTAKAAGKVFTVGGLEKFGQDLKDTYLPKLLGRIQSAFNDSATPTVSGMKIGLKLYHANNSTLAYVSSNGVGFELGVNLNYLAENGGNINMTDDLATTIAHEMMHAVMFDVTTNGMLGSGGGDSFPSWFVEGVAQSVGGAMNYLALMPSVNDADAMKKWMSQLTNTSDSYNAYAQGYLASMYLGYQAGGKNVSASAIADGLDTILKDISDGYSLGQAISRHTSYADLADFERNFASDEGVKFIKDLMAATGSGAGSIVSPNGLSGSKASLLQGGGTSNFFELDLDHNFVTNNMGGKNPYSGGGATTTSGTDRNGNKNPDAQPTWGSKLGNTGGKGSVARNLKLQIGSLSGQGVQLNCYKLSQLDLGINNVNVDSYGNAGLAINSFDNAISIVSDMRSYYGAIQNRLEHTIANLDNTSENIASAESKLRDTDMAETMVAYSKENILMQAGQTVLAQANHSKDGILSLLQ